MKKAMLVVLFFCLVLLSCTMGCRPLAQGSGSLVLGVSSPGVKGKTISPPLDLEIAYYDVRGAGPDSAAFSQLGVTGSTVVQNSIVAGARTITVDAYNAAHQLIGEGSVGVTVEAGLATQATVQVLPLAGTGSLTISVSWPPGVVVSPAVLGTLREGSEGQQSIPFTPGANSAAWTSPPLDVGYYSLIVQLADGSAVKWGLFEAVRILKDQTTAASFTLAAEDLQ
jgi:hypothetical protein